MPASERPAPPLAVPRPSGSAAGNAAPSVSPALTASPVVVDLPHRDRRASYVQSKRTSTIPPPAPQERATESNAAEGPPPPSSRGLRTQGSTGFAATFDDATIADLVQLECLRGMTRSVRVANDCGGEGILYFDQGQLVHAEVATGVKGEAAALEILSWQGGKTEPSAKLWLRAPTIETGWQGLLMAAAARSDEVARVRGEEGVAERAAAFGAQKGDTGVTEKQELPRGVLRCVRLDSDGQNLESGGGEGDFADAVAYTVRLAQLIGEGLGLEEFRGFQCKARDTTMVTHATVDGGVVAVEATHDADLSTYEDEAGV